MQIGQHRAVAGFHVLHEYSGEGSQGALLKAYMPKECKAEQKQQNKAGKEGDIDETHGRIIRRRTAGKGRAGCLRQGIPLCLRRQ
jgi:hypothetical protein